MQYRYLGKDPAQNTDVNAKLIEQFEVWTLNALKTQDVKTAAKWFGSNEEQLMSRFAKYGMLPDGAADI